MSLKREIGKLEQVEEMEEQTEERRQAEQRSIDEKLVGLYRRIDVIVEYIDNQTKEVTTITEEQLKQDEQHFIEEGIRKAWEIKALELVQKNKDLTKQLKEQENENAYNKGFEEGVNYTMNAAKEMTETFPNKEVIEAMQKVLSIKVPSPDSISGLVEILSQSVRSGKKENEESEKSQETDSQKTEKTRVSGLGRTVGDV